MIVNSFPTPALNSWIVTVHAMKHRTAVPLNPRKKLMFDKIRACWIISAWFKTDDTIRWCALLQTTEGKWLWWSGSVLLDYKQISECTREKLKYII